MLLQEQKTFYVQWKHCSSQHVAVWDLSWGARLCWQMWPDVIVCTGPITCMLPSEPRVKRGLGELCQKHFGFITHLILNWFLVIVYLRNLFLCPPELATQFLKGSKTYAEEAGFVLFTQAMRAVWIPTVLLCLGSNEKNICTYSVQLWFFSPSIFSPRLVESTDANYTAIWGHSGKANASSLEAISQSYLGQRRAIHILNDLWDSLFKWGTPHEHVLNALYLKGKPPILM